MKTGELNIASEIAAVNNIAVVPVILEVVCRTTGMGFAAVARVTDEQWVACAVRDEIQFGLVPGGELKLDTTICNEIRQSGVGVVIDHVKEDEVYRTHHTALKYGFQSYISVPISRNGDRFFGTLCAIDPKPALLNTPEIIGLFKAYANLISFYLNAVEQLSSEEFNKVEANVSTEISQHLNSIINFGPDTDNITKRDAKFVHILTESAKKINLLVDQLSAG